MDYDCEEVCQVINYWGLQKYWHYINTDTLKMYQTKIRKITEYKKFYLIIHKQIN